MNYYAISATETIKALKSNSEYGLTMDGYRASVKEYGANTLSAKKKKGVVSKIIDALREPMLLILLFGFIVAFGASIGKFVKTGEADFAECVGIFLAIVLSVSITLIMEGSSEKAFALLGKIYDGVRVKIVREGTIMFVPQDNLAVGDVVFLSSGDKIYADGRLIESERFSADESALTGESVPSHKDYGVVLSANTPLAERKNCVYSGTFVVGGNGKMVVTAVGDGTEMGEIAKELKTEKQTLSPLQTKLAKLGKIISLTGIVTAVFVFILSVIKLCVTGNVSFASVRELFMSCIILIIAAVPEGLPTIVAVSLALNMIKLAKGNALIKKMTATETAGAVSVICSDKTGTLTTGRMDLIGICYDKKATAKKSAFTENLIVNFFCNSTAEVSGDSKNPVYKGSGTECALIKGTMNAFPEKDYKSYRKKYKKVYGEPFSSDKKCMMTAVEKDGRTIEYVKGAPEKVLPMCVDSESFKNAVTLIMKEHEKMCRRVICFAHKNEQENYVYDGFAVLSDKIRPEAYASVRECKRAGIDVKILTGDNIVTATAIARELEIGTEKQAVDARYVEKMTDEQLKKALKDIKIVARSTPSVKLRIVKLLKESGEVVAVTGDGINDAPAIRHADVGIAMGKTGSDITKETADVVLLDDSFSTIVKAVAFGRNVYRNLQRFITFQLSVNFSALLIVTVTAVLGLPAPFNTVQLLWINVIMDGPPALTLGLESGNDNLMDLKPVRREQSIISLKTLVKIAINGLFMGITVLLQYTENFLKVAMEERNGTVFTLFILFQLFNAFNCRKLGSESVFKDFCKNKIMLVTFSAVLVLQTIMVTFGAKILGTGAIGVSALFKTIGCALTIIFVSETWKLIYRLIARLTGKKNGVREKTGIKRIKNFATQ